MILKCIARDSNLSRAQVKEVMQHASFPFEVNFIPSRGDLDQETSLINMPKNDFFTRELDEAVLNGEARIAIHSAKDLPDPLPKGLEVALLTPSLHPGDCLVMRPKESLKTLPFGAEIGASSVRREEMIRSLRPDLKMRSIRGTIEKRIDLLNDPTLYGVIIAKVALIRLELLHLNILDIDAPAAPLQGSLAIVCRQGDHEMKTLFDAYENTLSRQ